MPSSVSTISSKFQSTLSVRRATRLTVSNNSKPKISIHALRKESDHLSEIESRQKRISIHALRKESDEDVESRETYDEISIHALRKESDMRLSSAIWSSIIFQSTLSVRRATTPRAATLRPTMHFNPRSP